MGKRSADMHCSHELQSSTRQPNASDRAHGTAYEQVETAASSARRRDCVHRDQAEKPDVRVSLSLSNSIDRQGQSVVAVSVYDAKRICSTAPSSRAQLESLYEASFPLCRRKRFTLLVRSNADHLIHQKSVNCIWQIDLCAAQSLRVFKIPIVQCDMLQFVIMVDMTTTAYAVANNGDQRISLLPWVRHHDDELSEKLQELADHDDVYYTQACRGAFLAGEHAKRTTQMTNQSSPLAV